MRALPRSHWLERIRGLDPERDHLDIYRITVYHEFPWDVQRALELALYHTFAVPSVAAVLDTTGRFRTDAQARYDDTALLLDAVLEHGYDSPTGRAALSAVNRAHSRFALDQEDMRYVLAGFVVVPARWIDAYGWRPLLPQERHASYAYYREIGRRMGVRGIPASYEETVAFSDDYERRHVHFSPAGRRTAQATRELVAGWLPWLPASLVRRGATALLDPARRDAFGFPPAPLLAAAGRAALRGRAAVLRRLPARGTPRYGRTSRSVSAAGRTRTMERLAGPARPAGPAGG